MLAHEVLDPKNTLPHVKYCHLLLYLHYYVLVNICCDYPLSMCFSTAKPEWLWRLMKVLYEALTTMLAHEVLDPKNILPHVKYSHLLLYLHYYVLVNICCDYPLPVCFSATKPEWLWRLM